MKKKILIPITIFLCSFVLLSCNKTKNPTEPINNVPEETLPVETPTPVETPEPTKELTPTPTETKEEEIDILEGYTPSESKYTFSTENLDKVNVKPTFDISQYTNNAGAAIQPYQIFTDGMCLQRDAVNHLWGVAYDSKNIAIKINDKVYYGTVDENEEWHVYLPMMNAGGPYKMEIISEAGTKVINDVYIGEVYLFAGQSNMEWQIWISGTKMEALYKDPNVKNDKIRLLHIASPTSSPKTEPSLSLAKPIQWLGAEKESVRTFSAIAYVFGKKLQEELGCPVGLISTALGGTIIEHWLSRSNYNEVAKRYTPKIDNKQYTQTPCIGYNGVLYPLKGYTMRGVVWYQGCANTFGTEVYYNLPLETFIKQCREDYNNENLTFTLCELARYMQDPMAYSTINEKLHAVAKRDERVVVIRNLDLGNWFDIHPVEKRDIGTRAIDETLRVFYNKDFVAPVTIDSYTFNTDGTVTIVLSKNVELRNGTNGFEVYDGKNYTYDCNVTVNGNVLTVSADFVIKRVRYGYTCEMTNEIKNDVSKMVTVYDLNGMPLDLFHIKY